MINESIFREYDIRGIAGKELNREVAISVGRAFGTFLKNRIQMWNGQAWEEMSESVQMIWHQV